MKNINLVLVLSLFTLLSCKDQKNSILEITLTTPNSDPITSIKAFHLIQFQQSKQINQSYNNIACVIPNVFVLKNVKAGSYFVLLEIVKDNKTYNITEDSLEVKHGKNYFTKDIILSTHVNL